jgi:outer membrane protein assembly factor BamB
MGKYCKPLGLAVDGRVAYLLWREYDNRPTPQSSEEWKAREAEGPWQKGRLVAIDAHTGRERWVVRFASDDFLYAPVVMRNGTVVLSTRLMPGKFQHHLLAYSSSGKELWSYSEGDSQTALLPPIAGADGALYALPTDYPESNDLLRFSADGHLDWRVPVKPCLDQRDAGRHTTFPFLLDHGDIILAAEPDYAEDHRDDPYLVRLDGKSGREVWRYRLDTDPLSAPIMDRQGNIYCYTHYQLHAVGKNGGPLWQTRTDVVAGDLHIVGDLIYVAGNIIQPFTLQGNQIKGVDIALYVPGGPGQHYCIGNDWYYKVEGGIQAVRP